ncbi:site-2 protease family protein [Micrococcoides hystricis]|uniref:Site-2 protease family protein n=1 Tax=Micrococcoides hystricis TaxID=1572761 RepID=A0ABV6P7F2_9MICC
MRSAAPAAGSRNRIQVGRFGPVPIYLNMSWFLFGAVIVMLFSPDLNLLFPELTMIGAYVFALIAALFFALSVLVHELGHVAAARAFKTPVVEVELNLLGGFTRYPRGVLSAGQEAAMAAAGPLASAATSAIFFALAGLGHGPIFYIFLMLGRVNLLLTIFNLLPASSLDGGKIVESLLFKLTGKQRPGLIVTTIASAALIAVGLALLFLTEAGQAVLNQPLIVLMYAAVGGFLIMNLIRSWRRLTFLEKLAPLAVDQLSEPAPRQVLDVPVGTYPAVPFNAEPDEVLSTAIRTRSPYLTVIDSHNDVVAVIRYETIVSAIENNPDLLHLLRKDRT